PARAIGVVDDPAEGLEGAPGQVHEAGAGEGQALLLSTNCAKRREKARWVQSPRSAGQRLAEIVDQPRKHPVRIAPAVELAVEPGAKAARLPDVLQRNLGGSALPAETKKRFRARPMIDLDPAERVWRSEVDDF